jgi:hypothetical protein
VFSHRASLVYGAGVVEVKRHLAEGHSFPSVVFQLAVQLIVIGGEVRVFQEVQPAVPVEDHVLVGVVAVPFGGPADGASDAHRVIAGAVPGHENAARAGSRRPGGIVFSHQLKGDGNSVTGSCLRVRNMVSPFSCVLTVLCWSGVVWASRIDP